MALQQNVIAGADAEDRIFSKKERKKIDKFSSDHGLSKNDTSNLMLSNPGAVNSALDRHALENIQGNGSSKKWDPYVQQNLTQRNMRKIKTVSNTEKFTNGILKGTSDADRYVNALHLDGSREAGTKLYGFGAKDANGWSDTLKQAQNATTGAKVDNLVRHMNPLGGSSREALMSSMGFASKESKILAAKGSLMEKFSSRVATPGFGLFMAGSSLAGEDPLTEFASGTAMSWGGIQGWRAGKALGNFKLSGATHASRLIGGAMGGAIGAAVAVAPILALSDMAKSDSFIGKQAKKLYKQESMVFAKDTQESLTMRQAGLRKLSSSHLNNRGQLLGNEAQILRSGAM